MKFSIQVPILYHQTNNIEGKECKDEIDARKSLLKEIDHHIEMAKFNIEVLQEARKTIWPNENE